MSTEKGGKGAGTEAMDEAKALFEDAAAEEARQLDLLTEPLTSEEIALAQDQLGRNAGRLTVIHQARENRKGRTPGSRNRRTEDFVRYISQFGPDPAVVLMQIIGDTEEAMIERSYANDPPKHRLTWGDARSMKIRAAETLMPYFYGKQPVRVDATIRGVMVVEEVGGAPIGAEIVGFDPLGVLIDNEEQGDA
jgi:hypothetical protein